MEAHPLVQSPGNHPLEMYVTLEQDHFSLEIITANCVCLLVNLV